MSKYRRKRAFIAKHTSTKLKWIIHIFFVFLSIFRYCASFHVYVSRKRNLSFNNIQMVLTTPETIIEEAFSKNQSLLDDLFDECVLFAARRPIIMQFNPSALWNQWRGTVFSETWTFVVQNILFATIVTYLLHHYPIPAALKYNNNNSNLLEGLDEIWGQLLSVTTFTLTFFLNESYTLWYKCLGLSRKLQGRLNDLSFMLAAHAARTTDDSNTSSHYTPPARQILELIARYIRILNLFTYASFTLSHRPILTPRGMRRLVERHLLTPKEKDILVNSNKLLPPTQKHNMILLWITRVILEAREAGHIVGGAGFEEQFLEKIDSIRAHYGAIGGELQARMPFGTFHLFKTIPTTVKKYGILLLFFASQSSFVCHSYSITRLCTYCSSGCGCQFMDVPYSSICIGCESCFKYNRYRFDDHVLSGVTESSETILRSLRQRALRKRRRSTLCGYTCCRNECRIVAIYALFGREAILASIMRNKIRND